MIGIATLLAGALIQPAAAGAFVDRLMTDIAREHAPWREAPLVFLTDSDDGASCVRAMAGFAGAAPRPTLEIDGHLVRNVADIWRFAGTQRGYAGAEQPTPFERFARSTPDAFLVTTTTDNSWGAQLLADWLGRAVKSGYHESSHGITDVSRLTLVFQMPIYTQFIAGVSIDDLIQNNAVAEATVEGCTYTVVNRLRARAQLGCTAALIRAQP